jgi:uncharacterized protein (TIGR00725 family)
MKPRAHRLVIGVMGAAQCDAAVASLAEGVGRLIAERGAVLLCGGRTGVMEAAARGARQAGGLTVGVMGGTCADESTPNDFIDLALFTGMGEARNFVNACSSDAIIAIAGGWGTLSEIAMARKVGRPVVLLKSWDLNVDDLPRAASPEEAVELAFSAIRRAD